MLNEPDLSGTYTAQDYLDWRFEGLVELIRGKIFKMSPGPLPPHQVASTNLLRKFYQNFPADAQCQVFDAPTDVFLVKPGEGYRKTRNVVQPDIFVICDPSKITAKAIIGPPDLVVEILSPHNSKKDRKDKLELYEEYAVPEYWIVDPQKHSITAYKLAGGNKYQLQTPKTDGDVMSSIIFPNFKFEVQEVFKNLPGEK